MHLQGMSENSPSILHLVYAKDITHKTSIRGTGEPEKSFSQVLEASEQHKDRKEAFSKQHSLTGPPLYGSHILPSTVTSYGTPHETVQSNRPLFNQSSASWMMI